MKPFQSLSIEVKKAIRNEIYRDLLKNEVVIKLERVRSCKKKVTLVKKLCLKNSVKHIKRRHERHEKLKDNEPRSNTSGESNEAENLNENPINVASRDCVDVTSSCTACDDDHLLRCTECDDWHHGDCPVHGPFFHIRSKEVAYIPGTTRARASLPDGLYLDASSIPKAGTGVFAKTEIPSRTRFGPYTGNFFIDDIIDSGYQWEIISRKEISHYIDAKDEASASWLRFINCARTELEQNLIAFQYHSQIYYRTYKTIRPGQELLVWYGNQFAESLGLLEMDDKEQQKDPGFRRICTKCCRVFTSSRHLAVHHKHCCRTQSQCSSCGLLFDATAFSTGGVISSSSAAAEFLCADEECVESFPDFEALEKHLEIDHKIEKTACPICLSLLPSRAQFQRHTLLHNGTPLYCIKCELKLKNYASKKKDGAKRWLKRQCRTCRRKFLSCEVHQMHLMVCNKLLFHFACYMCRRAFLHQAEALNHVHKECTYLGKFFLPLSAAQQEEFHSSKCDFPFCGAEFKSHSLMNKHFRNAHATSKKRRRLSPAKLEALLERRRESCCICGVQLDHGRMLVTHIKKFHGRKDAFRCSKCQCISFSKQVSSRMCDSCCRYDESNVTPKKRKPVSLAADVKSDSTVALSTIDSRTCLGVSTSVVSSEDQLLSTRNMHSTATVVLDRTNTDNDFGGNESANTFFGISDFCLNSELPKYDSNLQTSGLVSDSTDWLFGDKSDCVESTENDATHQEMLPHGLTGVASNADWTAICESAGREDNSFNQLIATLLKDNGVEESSLGVVEQESAVKPTLSSIPNDPILSSRDSTFTGERYFAMMKNASESPRTEVLQTVQCPTEPFQQEESPVLSMLRSPTLPDKDSCAESDTSIDARCISSRCYDSSDTAAQDSKEKGDNVVDFIIDQSSVDCTTRPGSHLMFSKREFYDRPISMKVDINRNVDSEITRTEDSGGSRRIGRSECQAERVSAVEPEQPFDVSTAVASCTETLPWSASENFLSNESKLEAFTTVDSRCLLSHDIGKGAVTSGSPPFKLLSRQCKSEANYDCKIHDKDAELQAFKQLDLEIFDADCGPYGNEQSAIEIDSGVSYNCNPVGNMTEGHTAATNLFEASDDTNIIAAPLPDNGASVPMSEEVLVPLTLATDQAKSKLRSDNCSEDESSLIPLGTAASFEITMPQENDAQSVLSNAGSDIHSNNGVAVVSVLHEGDETQSRRLMNLKDAMNNNQEDDFCSMDKCRNKAVCGPELNATDGITISCQQKLSESANFGGEFTAINQLKTSSESELNNDVDGSFDEYSRGGECFIRRKPTDSLQGSTREASSSTPFVVEEGSEVKGHLVKETSESFDSDSGNDSELDEDIILAIRSHMNNDKEFMETDVQAKSVGGDAPDCPPEKSAKSDTALNNCRRDASVPSLENGNHNCKENLTAQGVVVGMDVCRNWVGDSNHASSDILYDDWMTVDQNHTGKTKTKEVTTASNSFSNDGVKTHVITEVRDESMRKGLKILPRHSITLSSDQIRLRLANVNNMHPVSTKDHLRGENVAVRNVGNARGSEDILTGFRNKSSPKESQISDEKFKKCHRDEALLNYSTTSVHSKESSKTTGRQDLDLVTSNLHTVLHQASPLEIVNTPKSLVDLKKNGDFHPGELTVSDFEGLMPDKESELTGDPQAKRPALPIANHVISSGTTCDQAFNSQKALLVDKPREPVKAASTNPRLRWIRGCSSLWTTVLASDKPKAVDIMDNVKHSAAVTDRDSTVNCTVSCNEKTHLGSHVGQRGTRVSQRARNDAETASLVNISDDVIPEYNDEADAGNERSNDNSCMVSAFGTQKRQNDVSSNKMNVNDAERKSLLEPNDRHDSSLRHCYARIAGDPDRANSIAAVLTTSVSSNNNPTVPSISVNSESVACRKRTSQHLSHFSLKNCRLKRGRLKPCKSYVVNIDSPLEQSLADAQKLVTELPEEYCIERGNDWGKIRPPTHDNVSDLDLSQGGTDENWSHLEALCATDFQDLELEGKISKKRNEHWALLLQIQKLKAKIARKRQRSRSIATTRERSILKLCGSNGYETVKTNSNRSCKRIFDETSEGVKDEIVSESAIYDKRDNQNGKIRQASLRKISSLGGWHCRDCSKYFQIKSCAVLLDRC